MKYDEIITDYPSDQLTLGKLKGLLETVIGMFSYVRNKKRCNELD